MEKSLKEIPQSIKNNENNKCNIKFLKEFSDQVVITVTPSSTWGDTNYVL